MFRFLLAGSAFLAMMCIAAPCLQAAATRPAANAPTTQAFAVAEHGSLQLAVPVGWNSVGRAPQLTFVGDDPRAFRVMLTVVPAKDKQATTPERVRVMAEEAGQTALATAKERKLTLEEIKGTDAIGYVFNLTDRAPAPGSFERMTGGVVATGDLLLSVTILYHDSNAPEIKLATEMLASAVQTKGDGAQPANQPGVVRVSAAGGWDLVLKAEGVTVVQEKNSPDGKSRQLMAANEQTGLALSVFLEPPQGDGDSTAVRDFYWGRAKKSPLVKKDVKLNELDLAGVKAATVEYLVPKVQHQVIDQKNVNVYVSYNGVWIDVHISKTKFKDTDQPLLDEIIKSIRFEKRQ